MKVHRRLLRVVEQCCPADEQHDEEDEHPAEDAPAPRLTVADTRSLSPRFDGRIDTRASAKPSRFVGRVMVGSALIRKF